MRTRFSTAAGFLAAASLLSSSAFAFAPEFDGDLPTVIITDRLPGPPAVDPFDPGMATTQFLFRFTGAFDLLDYIQLGPTGTEVDPDEVRFLFNEFDNADSLDPNLRDQGVLLINGERAFATSGSTYPDQSDFATAPLVTARYGSGDGRLDFRNRDFSGDDESDLGPFSGIGAVTGDDFTISGSQERVVQLYISTDEADDYDLASFLAITATDPAGDRLSTGFVTEPVTAVFDPVYEADDFGGWEVYAQGRLLQIPTNGPFDLSDPSSTGQQGTSNTAIGGFSGAVFNAGGTQSSITVPVAGSGTPSFAPAGTSAVQLSGTNAQFGLAGWQAADSLATMEPNRLYQLRARVQSLNASQIDRIRVRFGGQYETGESEGGYQNGANVTNIPSGKVVPRFPVGEATDYYQYLLSKGEGEFRPAFELVSSFNTSSNAFRLSELELSVADRADLGEGNVIVNFGGAVSSPFEDEADYTPIAANPEAFVTTGNEVGRRVLPVGGTINSAQTVNTSATAGLITMTIAQDSLQANANIIPDFSRIGFQDSGSFDLDAPEVFEVQEGKIYIVDVWIATTTPANAGKPALRVTSTVSRTYSSETNFSLTANDLFGAPNPVRVTQQPRAYSTVLAPQLNGNGTGWATLAVDFLHTLQKTTASNNIRVHRITVTEYDDPVLGN